MVDSQPTTSDLMLIEQRVTNEGPSVGTAYLLCIFLGWISAHRFYLGKPKTACLQIASWLVMIQPFWWFIDLFLIPGLVRARQAEIRARYLTAIRQPLAATANP